MATFAEMYVGAAQMSPVLGNSEHPIGAFLPLTMKRVPKRKDLFYAVAKDDSFTITVRGDVTGDVIDFGVYPYGYAEFKRRMIAGEFLGEAYDLRKGEGDKYIGDAILRELRMYSFVK